MANVWQTYKHACHAVLLCTVSPFEVLELSVQYLLTYLLTHLLTYLFEVLELTVQVELIALLGVVQLIPPALRK